LEIVVSGVTAFRASSFMFPDNGSVEFADRKNVFTIGSSHENKAIFFSQESQGQKEE
jgi:hypothetical protein